MDFGQYLKYGIEVAVIAALFFIVWRILIWVMKWVDKQAEQHLAERIAWLKALETLNASITTSFSSINNLLQMHIQSSIEARKITEEAHRFQREEHLKMVENQTKFIAQEAIVCKCLEEVKDGLGRVNGFKHEG